MPIPVDKILPRTSPRWSLSMVEATTTYTGVCRRAFFAHHGYSVLVPDLPGHGRSEGPAPENVDDYTSWLWRFLDAVGVQKAALVGHSMGSLITLAAAAQQPERMLALGLAGTSDHMQVHPDLLELAAADDPKAFELITEWGFGKTAHIGGHQAPGLWMRGGGRALLASCAPGVLGTDMAACNNWGGAVDRCCTGDMPNAVPARCCRPYDPAAGLKGATGSDCGCPGRDSARYGSYDDC